MKKYKGKLKDSRDNPKKSKKAEKKKKSKKTLLFVLKSCISIIFIGILSIIVFFAGFAFGTYELESTPEIDYENQNVYIKGNFDWIYSELDEQQKEDLLTSANQNFNLVFNVENEAEYRDFFEIYREFILINLENQRRNLIDVFNYPQLPKADIILTNTFERYTENFNPGWQGDLSFTAYADPNNSITIYLPSDIIISNDKIADLITHELVHLFQYPQINFYTDIPSWYIEGMAEYYSTRGNVLNIPNKTRYAENIDQLEDIFTNRSNSTVEDAINNYQITHSFYQYIASNYESELIQVLKKTTQYQDFDTTFTNLIGKSPSQMYQEWLDI